MKFLLFIFITLFSLSACAQNGKSLNLPRPSDKLLAAKDTVLDIGYLYLLENWKVVRGKEVTKKFTECLQKNCDCEWNVKFENNILYEFECCDEIGSSIRISFKNVKKDEVVKLVNLLFKNDQNIWNQDFTKYEPKESGDAGCYYEIIENENSVTLDYYCGC